MSPIPRLGMCKRYRVFAVFNSKRVAMSMAWAKRGTEVPQYILQVVKNAKTYNSWDSLVVTHPTTNQPI